MVCRKFPNGVQLQLLEQMLLLLLLLLQLKIERGLLDKLKLEEVVCVCAAQILDRVFVVTLLLQVRLAAEKVLKVGLQLGCFLGRGLSVKRLDIEEIGNLVLLTRTLVNAVRSSRLDTQLNKFSLVLEDEVQFILDGCRRKVVPFLGLLRGAEL